MAGVVGRAFKISKNQAKGYGYTKPNRRRMRSNPGVTTIAAINGRGAYAANRKHRLNRARKALSSAEKKAFAARMAKARGARLKGNIGRMGRKRKKLAANYGTHVGAVRGWRTRRARAAAKRTTPKRKRASAKKRVTRAATRRPTTMRRRKVAAKAATKRRRRKSSKRRSHAKKTVTRRRKHRRNKAHAAPKKRRKRRKARAKTATAPKRRRRRRKSAKRTAAPKRRRRKARASSKRKPAKKKRRSRRKASMKSNRRRSRRKHRRNPGLKANRRRSRKSGKRRSHRRNAKMSSNRRRSHKRRHRSNKRHRRNGMFKKNGVGGLIMTGGTLLGGFFAHRLLSNLLNTQVLGRLLPAAPPAAAGIADTIGKYSKPISQLAAAIGGVLLVRATVKDDKTKQLLIGGIVASALHGVVVSVLQKFAPGAADMLAGPNDGTAARISAMYGMGAGESIQPRYAPIGEYFANPMGEYFQSPMGEYIASTNGLGTYERANLMEAAAGYGAVVHSQGTHIDPSSDLDRQLTIAEAAAGVGAVSPFEAAAGVMPFEASAGMGAIASLPSADTWIPGSSNPQLWAGVREVTQNQSEHELTSAGVLQSGGSQGIFG